MPASFEFSALRYLNIWIKDDRFLCEGICGSDQKARLKSLKDGAALFRIARNLPKEFDVGRKFPRYSPVLKVLDKTNKSDFDRDCVVAIMNIKNEISKEYGNREVLSLTTKLLWLKFKSPIIIYDQQVRKSIDTPIGDYQAFYDSWRKEFLRNEKEISAACDTLVDVLKYTIDTSVATFDFVDEVSKQKWFKERVFDIYLWQMGSKNV